MNSGFLYQSTGADVRILSFDKEIKFQRHLVWHWNKAVSISGLQMRVWGISSQGTIEFSNYLFWSWINENSWWTLPRTRVWLVIVDNGIGCLPDDSGQAQRPIACLCLIFTRNTRIPWAWYITFSAAFGFMLRRGVSTKWFLISSPSAYISGKGDAEILHSVRNPCISRIKYNRCYLCRGL